MLPTTVSTEPRSNTFMHIGWTKSRTYFLSLEGQSSRLHPMKYDKSVGMHMCRTEVTDIDINSAVSNTTVEKNYVGFFPSAHLSYALNDLNTFQVSYSRRLSRPRFRELLPFSSYSDSRNFRMGNPDLDPEYTNSFELGYLRYWKTGSLLSSEACAFSISLRSRMSSIGCFCRSVQ